MRPDMQNAALAAVRKTFRAFCIGMDTPRALKAHLLLEHGEYEQLARMKIHPSEYTTADSFAKDYAVVSFLKKNADLPKVLDVREAAITAFASSEESCRITNSFIESYQAGTLFIEPRVAEVIHLAQRKIARLLSRDLDITNGPYSWGPGATFDLKKSKAYADTKLVELPFTVTGSAWKHAAALINSDLHWKEAIIAANPGYTGPIFKIVPGGRYDTVRKTVLTDRSILIEARLNTVLQKRAGDEIRHLLKRVGIDLNDQSRNQILAGMARTLGLATLDLEAASDTVSRKVVELLLPDTWFTLLDDLRSKWVLNDEGVWVRLEKFSSMGNGFTFELESLIFWALASAASELEYHSIVGVYGDDIIVQKEVAPLLTETLRVLGFTLNQAKSFTTGDFFESCGKHYFKDIDVTPFYQKCLPTDRAEAARMGNRLLRFAARLGLHVTFDKRVRGAWEEWRRHWREPGDADLGPYVGEGDGYWESPLPSVSARTRAGIAGLEYRVACYSTSRREIPACDEAMYALWLMQSRDRHPDDLVRGVTHSQAISRLRNMKDPLVTVTGTSRKKRITLNTAESGFIASRTKYPEKRVHMWVQEHPYSTGLDW